MDVSVSVIYRGGTMSCQCGCSTANKNNVLAKRWFKGAFASALVAAIPAIQIALESEDFSNLVGPSVSALIVGILLAADKAFRWRT
jgi:hypothetical protein